MKVNTKVWIEDGEGNYLFGYGVAEILEGIDRLGSIAAVAKSEKRSYRYVWGRIRRAEEIVGFKLVETTLGGRETRRSRLTPQGCRWLSSFMRFRSSVKEAADRYFARHMAEF